jgi:hypothetical protein
MLVVLVVMLAEAGVELAAGETLLLETMGVLVVQDQLRQLLVLP